ncbi:hypothetical protein KEM55_002330 [Ascosphaera atra]|nr:hypothetical protein KEM55_002330 [Ascosphaera atra]
MDPPSVRISPSKSAVLFPVSPERLNQQKFVNPPESPSKHARAPGELQARNARLNGFGGENSPAHTNGNVSQSVSMGTTAALQRAVLGREEAESALKNTQEKLAEANERERQVSKKLEALLGETRDLKEKHAQRQAHERSIFEKEVKKARKEAFRAGSALVKLQEDLKTARGDIRALQDEVQREKDAREQASQKQHEFEFLLHDSQQQSHKLKEMIHSLEQNNRAEALEEELRAAQDEIITLQSQGVELEHKARTLDREVQQARQQISTLQDDLKIERDAHERTTAESLESNNIVERLMSELNSLREQLQSKTEDLETRNRELAAEKQKALRRSRLSSSMHKRTQSAMTPMTNATPKITTEANDTPMSKLSFLTDSDLDSTESLKRDLRWEKKLRQRAEEMVEYMKIECQFKRCSCRLAEERGARYVHDTNYDLAQPDHVKDEQHGQPKEVAEEHEDVMDIELDPEPVVDEGAAANDSGLGLTMPEDELVSPRPAQTLIHSPHHPTGDLLDEAPELQITPEGKPLEIVPESGTIRATPDEHASRHHGIAESHHENEGMAQHDARSSRMTAEEHMSHTPQLQRSFQRSGTYEVDPHTGRRALTSTSQHSDVQVYDHPAPSVPPVETHHFYPKEGAFKAKRYHPAPPPRRFRIEKEKAINTARERQHVANVAREHSGEPTEYPYSTHDASITSSRSNPLLHSSLHHSQQNQGRAYTHPPPEPAMTTTPASLSREEALAQIRARRERTAQKRSNSAMDRPYTSTGFRAGDAPVSAGKRRAVDGAAVGAYKTQHRSA